MFDKLSLSPESRLSADGGGRTAQRALSDAGLSHSPPLPPSTRFFCVSNFKTLLTINNGTEIIFQQFTQNINTQTLPTVLCFSRSVQSLQIHL